MIGVNNHLNKYRVFPFEKALSIDLNKRYDFKCLLRVEQILEILSIAYKEFDIQETKGSFLQEYQTRYWDTSDLFHFKQHALGRPNRIKVRKRFYKETQTCFLEVKKKEKGRTNKIRLLSEYTNDFSISDQEFLLNNSIDHAKLNPVIDISYQRLILWHQKLKGRVTIDFNFEPINYGKSFVFSQVAILEIKGDPSFLNKTIRSLGIPLIRFATSFTKYGIGLTHTHGFSRIQSKSLFNIHKNLIKLNK